MMQLEDLDVCSYQRWHMGSYTFERLGLHCTCFRLAMMLISLPHAMSRDLKCNSSGLMGELGEAAIWYQWGEWETWRTQLK